MIAKIRRSLWVGIAVVVTAGGLLAPLVMSQQKVSAVSYVVDGKVTICHRTNSATNPYVQETVSVNAVDGEGQNDHSHHTGPIASSEAIANNLKSNHINWGDIIPPVPGHNGLNWTVVGQAMWHNGCDFPKVASASVSVTPATCESGAILVYGPITNATWDPTSTPNGTVGATPQTPYSVTAIANIDALFNPNLTKKVMTGDLAGKIGYQSTNPEADCYKPPVELPRDAAVVLDATEPTCYAGAKLIFKTVDNATFTSGDAAGVEGPRSYSSTFTAAQGHLFASGQATATETGTLDGPLTEGCNPEIALATAGVKINPATCKLGETISYVNVKNATVREGSTPEGVHVDTFTVTFDATNDAVFDEEGATSLVISEKLAGPSTDPSCEEGQVLGETATPATPAQLPKTSGEGTTVIAVSGTLLALVGGVVALRRFFDRGL